MSTPVNPPLNVTAQGIQAVADLAQGAIKTAAELQRRLTLAPKAVDPAELEKTAQVLVDNGFLDPAQKQAAAQALADPLTAVQTIQGLAQKAAAAVGQTPNTRLAAGTLQTEPTRTKEAYDGNYRDPDSEADRQFHARMAAYKVRLGVN